MRPYSIIVLNAMFLYVAKLEAKIVQFAYGFGMLNLFMVDRLYVGSSQFTQLPQKMELASTAVKSDSNIIIPHN
jgi:hypothetical protein